MKNYNLRTTIVCIALLLSTVSCNKPKENPRLTNCNSKLIEVNAKYDSLWQNELKLEQELEHSIVAKFAYQKRIKELEEKVKEIVSRSNIADSLSFQYLKDNYSVSEFDSNKDIFGFMFSNFVLGDRSFLYNVSGFIYNDSNKFSSLIKEIDRSESSIKSLYTENDKRFIYSLFMHNDYYKTSGLQCIVEGLLLAHDEIGNDEELLYIINNINTGKGNWSERSEMVDNITSNEMKEVLSDENYGDKTSDIDNRLFYVYSFWARRYHEDNSDIVYKILSDFHKNVKN